ncbi:MAG: rod-binding protein [Planctomycetes bacterium]|nr:rod-binding protein [Planctomycetota bacterium]
MSTIGSSMVSSSLPLPQSAGSSHSSSRPVGGDAAANVAQDFESVFASMLLKEMRQSLEPGTLFGEDSGDVYGGLFDRYFGEQMTKGSGLGMAEMVQSSIERLEKAGSHRADSPGAAASLPPASVPDKRVGPLSGINNMYGPQPKRI